MAGRAISRWREFALTAALLLATATASAQTWPAELQPSLELLKSEDPKDRLAARDDLTRAIARVPEPRRGAVIAELIQVFPGEPWRVRLAVAIALSKQAAPWNAPDLDRQVRTLYNEFVNRPDETLGPAIDDALANAKGYYRDAITDFNQDRIDDIDAVIAKFKKTSEPLPKSRYASNSTFYLAQYLTRAYLLGHAKGRSLVENASAVLAAFLKVPESAKSDFWDDAFYYLALNRILVDDKAGAIATLRDMEKKFSERDRVYVYQFFYSKDKATVVDSYFPASTLAKKTQEYIEKFNTISPADQSAFIAYVTKK